MLVKTNASIKISASSEAVFDFMTALSTLPKVFRGYGPIPAIINANMADNGKMREGGVRRVENSDGSVIDEEILTLKRPERQTYRLIRGFKIPISILIQSGGGDWTLTPMESSTHLNWEFYFILTSPVFYPIGRLLIDVFMNKAMQQCLNNIKDFLENKT